MKATAHMKASVLRLLAALLLGVPHLHATPSTQVWIPSTDIQPFGVPHLGFDSYIRSSGHGYYSAGDRDPDVFVGGLTIGVLPFQSVQMEVGVDYISTFSGLPTDDHPVYFNAKIGVPESVLFTNAPALAIGGYNFGTKCHHQSRTDQNIVYGLAGKTLPAVCGLPSLGRLSAGYYVANNDVIVGPGGRKDNHGVLLSWDRTMTELSDKLWMAVDYQGGENALGALNFGVAWAFTPNVSMIVGYDLYNKKSLAGSNTFTIQWDINF